LHDQSGGIRLSGLEIDIRQAFAERLVRTKISHDDPAAHRHLREVDDDVGSFGRSHEQLSAPYGRVEKAAIHANLPEREIRPIQLQDEKPRVAPVEKAEPVPPLFDVQVRPRPPVDDDGVSKELRIPNRRDVADAVAARFRNERNLQLAGRQTLEKRARVGVVERSVRVE
jgi:hypothetical protein